MGGEDRAEGVDTGAQGPRKKYKDPVEPRIRQKA